MLEKVVGINKANLFYNFIKEVMATASLCF